MLKILIAGNDPAVFDPLRELLTAATHVVTQVWPPNRALAFLRDETIDLVIGDVDGRDNGLDLLRLYQRAAPDADVVVTTGAPSVSEAVAVIREGALDYLAKPFDRRRVLEQVARLEGERELRRSLDGTADREVGPDDEMLGRSAGISRLRERIAVIARSASPVLITGESGTGKELAARALHRQSPRRGRPMIAVNCAALPPQLIEAELFGHERGAFTGADRRRDGRFVAADGGTLLLDEVGDLPLMAQVKLLRVLQEGTLEPIGSNKTVKVDVRVLSATHHDLQKLVAAGRFREDLFYRLRVFELALPPLRDRPSDLPLLVERFVRQFGRAGQPVPAVSSSAWSALASYDFPGNIRELENAINHAVTLCRGSTVELHHLPPEIREREARGPAGPG